MKDETLEEYTNRLADEIVEGKREFLPNEEPSPEARLSIVQILSERGYNPEFYRYANDLLRISCSEISDDDEQNEIIGVEPW